MQDFFHPQYVGHLHIVYMHITKCRLNDCIPPDKFRGNEHPVVILMNRGDVPVTCVIVKSQNFADAL